ncbi:MAG: hypothetical protein KY467_07980 [Gemmatimonadetes bacterium]|nr:hypothetical protein [Gemmatimonadota bacterium]
MDFVKCWSCGPAPLYPVVMIVLGAAILLFVWKSLRPPRRPDWWRSGRHRIGQ